MIGGPGHSGQYRSHAERLEQAFESVPHSLMAAGGMKYGEDRLSLAQRPIGGQPSPDERSPEPHDGKPCWVRLGDRQTPATVHAWRQDSHGRWHALVVAWLPSSAVTKRDPGDASAT